MTVVDVPQLGHTVEECLVARWFKRPGDEVTAGEVIAEIETDKSTFEITAPVDGTVLEIFVEEGATAPVFTRLVAIGEPGEHWDPEPAAPAQAVTPGSTSASPRARRLAATQLIDVAALNGSGPGGRVIERDVRAAIEEAALTRPGARLSPARQAIARRMRDALAATAQYTLHTWAPAAGLLAARAALKAQAGREDITLTDLITFCAVRAVARTPALNAALVDGHLVTAPHVNLAFACDTPRGLVAPVVRAAESLTVDALAAAMQALARAAIDGRLPPSDFENGTFTISNLGALGIEAFTPVLTPPQVAILGVGAVHVKPVRTEAGIEFVDALSLSLTCDHQAIDGAPAARFLRVLRETIEAVETIIQ